MNNPRVIFNTLLALAFVFQLLIDVGGFLGWYYSQYSEKVFEFAGFGALLPLPIWFSAYLLWILIYNISIALMFMQSNFAKYFVFTSLAISCGLSYVTGIAVVTPIELFLGWVGWSTYMAACTIFFVSNVLKNA